MASSSPREASGGRPDQGGASTAGRRDQILDTAERLFARGGYRETGLLDVAAELGVRRQAVYHYFRSKEEILYELIGRAGAAVSGAGTPVLDSDLPPREMLVEVVRNHVRGLAARPDVFRIQFAELPKLQGARADELRAEIEEYVGRVASVIKAGQQDGIFAPGHPTAMALMVIGMCNFTIEWHAPGVGLTDDEVADLCVRTALTGVTGASLPG